MIPNNQQTNVKPYQPNYSKIHPLNIEIFGGKIPVFDKYLYNHLHRTADYSKSIADKLGIDYIELVYVSGLLHDIGKILIPTEILKKSSSLNCKEKEKMRKHTLESTFIIQKHLPPTDYTKNIIFNVFSHHEKYDGSGYPYGLKGDNIPLIARIISVADAYDALTNDRVYRKGISKESAIEEIKKNTGSHFDPEIVDKFLELIKKDELKNKNNYWIQ